MLQFLSRQVETIEKPAPGPTKLQTSKYTQYLNDWTQGQPLYGYDRFADWMAALVNSFIDWQTHGISLTQAHEYVAAGRFALEGQSGALMPNRMYLHFKRTPELRQVFQALADFNDPNVVMQADQYGEHLATLSTWLRREEPRIVEFVREPTGKVTEPGYLTRILLLNCVGLACLAGELTPAAADSNVDLYQQLIVSCVRSSADGWKSQVQQAQVERPQAWLDLMRKVNVQEAVHVCRSELLQLLNRPQGSSSNVRYLDAATALGVLADFNATEWCYTPLTVRPQTNDRIWTSGLVVYDALAERFAATCRGAHDTLSTAHTRLRAYLGNATPKDAFDAIRNLLHDLKQVRAYDSKLDLPFDR